MIRSTRVALFGAALALVSSRALAATEAQCEAAIVDTQRALLSAPVLENAREGRRERIMAILAEAGAAGERGDQAGCLKKTAVARGIAGLT